MIKWMLVGQGVARTSHYATYTNPSPTQAPQKPRRFQVNPLPHLFFFSLRLETLKSVQQRPRIVHPCTKASFHASHCGPGRVQSIPLGIHLLRSARSYRVSAKPGDAGRNQFHIQHLSSISELSQEYCLEIKSRSGEGNFPIVHCVRRGNPSHWENGEES